MSDLKVYTRLAENPTVELRQKIKRITTQALQSKLISKKEWQFLNPVDSTLARFYLVPKIHKDLLNPPGRPIVSTRGSLLEPQSIFLDSYLRPRIASIPSYIKDLSHFLHILSDNNQWASEPDLLLVTLDVVSLYTVIPQAQAHSVVMASLHQRGDLSEQQLNLLSEFTSLTLYNNFFEFEDAIYLQCSGVAMGATCAPSVANLYMQKFEHDWLENSPYLTSIKLWR